MTIQFMPPVTWVDNANDMMKFVKHVRDTKECALDTETTGLNRWKDHVLFWSACPDEKSRYCFTREMLRIYDRELSQDPSIEWDFTNAPFDFAMIRNSGARAPVGDTYCTLAMDWMHDENRQGRHGLKETAWDHLNLGMQDFNEAFKGRAKGESLQDRLMRAMKEDWDTAVSYASADAYATFRVKRALKKKLQDEYSRTTGNSLWSYFKKVEMPFTRILADMNHAGIMVDVGHMHEISPGMEAEILYIDRQIAKIAGKEINYNSTAHLRWLLFEKLGLKVVKYTKGGNSGNRQPSTDKEVMELYADQGVEVCDMLNKRRKIQKTLSTYVHGLQKWLDPNLRIHPTLTQHVTVTGRLSSVDPNLQNIPRPDNDVFGLREMFMPTDHHVLLVSDYEQLEMRLLAHMSGEENMQDVINNGWDIHAGTGSLMYGFDYDDIIAAGKKKKAAAQDSSIELTENEKQMVFARAAAKSIGFGLNYGEGPKKLAHSLGVSVDDAKELTNKYFEPYPRVREYISGKHAEIRKRPYTVETILGRPRRFPNMEFLSKHKFWDLRGHERKLLSMCERQSVNSAIQGSAADVAKMAMILCANDPTLRSLGVKLLLQIHDELIFEVPEDSLEKARPLIKEMMEHPFEEDLSVPLACDDGVGYSWASAKA